ncbi:unnamed protein product [Effrenium voratum]|nr:unnamed protein product [Effrenium voratum]
MLFTRTPLFESLSLECRGIGGDAKVKLPCVWKRNIPASDSFLKVLMASLCVRQFRTDLSTRLSRTKMARPTHRACACRPTRSSAPTGGCKLSRSKKWTFRRKAPAMAELKQRQMYAVAFPRAMVDEEQLARFLQEVAPVMEQELQLAWRSLSCDALRQDFPR